MKDVAAKRLEYVDIAKGISMLCIIAGHMGVAKIDRFVFTFHVPIFFLISGYFYNYRKGIVKKRLKQMILPYLLTSLTIIVFLTIRCFFETENMSDVIQTIITWCAATIYGSGSRTDFWTLNIQSIGAIWFLLAEFWVTAFFTLIYQFTNTLSKSATHHLMLVGLSLIFFRLGVEISNYTWLPFSVQSGMTGLIFFVIGYIYKQIQMDLNQKKKLQLHLCIVLIFIWVVSLYRSFVTGELMSAVKSYFPSPFLDIIGAIGGSLVIVRLSEWIEKSKIVVFNKFLSFFGKNSLICLCVHLVELNCFQYDKLFWFIKGRKKILLFVFLFKVAFNMFMVLIINLLKDKKTV